MRILADLYFNHQGNEEIKLHCIDLRISYFFAQSQITNNTFMANFLDMSTTQVNFLPTRFFPNELIFFSGGQNKVKTTHGRLQMGFRATCRHEPVF